MPEASGAQGLEELRPGVCSVLLSAGRIQSSSNISGAMGVEAATLLPLGRLPCGNSQPDPNLVQAETVGSVVQQKTLAWHV